jgi:hypothetical protein
VETGTPQEIRINYLAEAVVDIHMKVKSPDLAPVGFYTAGWDTKMNLKAGDHVDVCDEAHYWYRSTIIGRRFVENKGVDCDGKPLEEIIVGYRYYDKSGNKADPNGRAFTGYSPAWDQVKLLSNISVQLEGTMVQPYTSIDGGDDCKNTKNLRDWEEDVFITGTPATPRTYCTYRRDCPITEYSETVRIEKKRY